MHGNTSCQGGTCGPTGTGKEKLCGWCKGPTGGRHNHLCALWTLAVLTFVLGAVAWVGAWVTDLNGTTWLGMGADHLFHDATILFVLSLMFKMKKHWLKRELMAASMCGSGGHEAEGCCGDSGCGEGESGCGKEGCCKA